MNMARLIGATVLTALLLFAGGAYAADGENGWKTEIAPYAWFPSLVGTIQVKDQSTNVNLSFADLWKYMDIGGMLHMETRKERVAILFDATDAQFTVNRPLVRVDITLFLAELGGVYQVLGPEKGPGLALDVLAGGRYMYLKDDTTLFGTINKAGRQDWIDPFVGARVRWGLTKKLLLVARGDTGAWSRGSKSSWNAQGIVLYNFTESFSVGGGYRAFYDHYENGNTTADKFEWNATIKGPFVGVAFKF